MRERNEQQAQDFVRRLLDQQGGVQVVAATPLDIFSILQPCG